MPDLPGNLLNKPCRKRLSCISAAGLLCTTLVLALTVSGNFSARAHGTEVHPPQEPAAEEMGAFPQEDTQPLESRRSQSLPEEDAGTGTDPSRSVGDMAAGVSSSGHDHAEHAHGSWAVTPLQRVLAWVGRFHPALTNFPIALLLAAALAELLFMATGQEGYRHAARFCLWVGGLGALAAALTGWLYAGFQLAADDFILAVHRWNGTALAVLALAGLWLGERHMRTGRRGGYRACLFLIALLAGVNGYLGGVMLYGADHYAWPGSAEVHDHDRDHDHGDAAHGH